MKPVFLSYSLQVSPLILAVTLFCKTDSVLSQPSNIVPDNTLGDETSQVVENFNDQPIEVITGGAQREQNLFHSFQEFNVSEGRGAYFNSPDVNIQNIFSRVTGGNPSEIMGVLGTFGESNPNLYLINPNGILFGENASLDVGGSFAATTASGIEFGEQGNFDTINPQIPQLLTIDPSAYLFNQIDNQNISGIESQAELTIPEGENLVFLGGDINLTGSNLTAPGGGIELGSIQETGKVEINENITFPDDVARGNISLSEQTLVNVISDGDGTVIVESQNLELIENSVIVAGIGQSSNNPNLVVGDIVINVVENLQLDESNILNLVASGAKGNAGNIEITTGSLFLTNGGIVNASSLGQGNAGSVDITATNTIIFNGENSRGISSGAISQVEPQAEGDAGNIKITTGSLFLTSGGRVSVSTSGKGSAGAVDITATDTITFDGEDSSGIASGITSQMGPEAKGNAGNVKIITGFLTLTNGGRISSSTFGQGNAGSVDITATDTITFDGENSLGFSSRVVSQVDSEAEGDAGDVTITTGSLTLTNGADISASTFGKGNAGSVDITATDNITFDGEDSGGISSGASSSVNPKAEGDARGVTITTGSLTLTNGGVVDASTFGKGNAGSVNIMATDTITFDGENSLGTPSRATSQVNPEAEGDAGGVTIITGSLFLTNGADIDASTFSKGNAGSVDITATDTIIFDGEDTGGISSGATSIVLPQAEGDAGGVRINTGSLTLTNGATINASTLGQGNAGSIDITATDNIIFDGEDTGGISSGATSIVLPQAEGDAGGVRINTGSLTLTNGATINASTLGQGNAGSIDITATDTITFDGENSGGIPSRAASQVDSGAEGDAGGVTIITGSLFLTNGADIDASTFTKGNAGSVDITATDTIIFDGKNSGGIPSGTTSTIQSGAEGDAGGITIITGSLFLTNGARIDTSTLGSGRGGGLKVNADFFKLDNGSFVASESESIFDAGDITLNIANSLQVTDSEISTNSIQSSGGNLTISAGDIQLRGDSDIRTNINGGEGGGGNINLTADSILAFDDSDIFAFAADGQGGNITLNTPAFFAENFTLNSLTSDPEDLEDNNRPDINATGAVSGVVDIPDVSFIQNSLTELPDNSINTNELVANSCVSPVGNRQQGKFIITGGDSLPVRPGNADISAFATGDVRGVSEVKSGWQRGDEIVEPQGVYRLANGKLILSRECNEKK